MPITMSCPQCNRTLRVPAEMAGQRGRCPTCNGTFDIPAETSSAVPSTAPSSAYTPSPIPPPPPPPPPDAAYGDSGRRFEKDDYGYDRRDDFQHMGYGTGVAVLTPPKTFHTLYLALVALTIAQFVGMGLYFATVFWVASVQEQRRSRQTFQNVAWEIDNGNNPGKVRRTPPPPPPPGSDVAEWIILPALGFLLLAIIAQVVVFFMIIYKAWALIQDGAPQTTPGKAVGFCFIPFFNLYWMFIAIRGLCEDLNRYSSRQRLHAREANVGLATGYLVCKLCQIIPCVGYLMMIVTIVLELMTMYSIKNAAADIAAAKMGGTVNA